VHCAVLGGNCHILKWLVDGQCCPIAVKRDVHTGRMQSVQTSTGRSLVDLAMTGKPKLEILSYLVMNKKLSVLDTKDPSLAPRALEALLRAGVSPRGDAAENPKEYVTGQPVVEVTDDLTEHSGTSTLDDAVSKTVVYVFLEQYRTKMLVVSASCVTRNQWTASLSRAVIKSAARTVANISTSVPSAK
jgi:hypothetical protein